MSPEGNVYQKNVSREKLSVWAGLCGNGQVIGPLFYEGNLTGERYMEMLNNSIIPLMQQAYGHLFRYVWFMQDGAPAHRMIIIRNKLQELFGHRVIRLGFDVEWPPRSPDLTPCDFFLWGHLKNQVYKTPPPSLEILRHRIEEEFRLLKNKPQVIKRAVNAMRHRAITCAERNGGHVEGYL